MRKSRFTEEQIIRHLQRNGRRSVGFPAFIPTNSHYGMSVSQGTHRLSITAGINSQTSSRTRRPSLKVDGTVATTRGSHDR